MFSRSKAARWRSGDKMARRERFVAARHRRATRRGPHPGVLDDRGQVHVVDVRRPGDHAGVEAERLSVRRCLSLPQGDEAVDAEVGLGLGVGAVQLGVPEGALGLGAPLLDARGEIGTLAPHREGAQDPLGGAERFRGALQLALDAAAARERPLRHHDGLPVGVIERVIGEPRPNQVDQLSVAQRVPHARGDVVDDGARRVGARGGHDDDRRHHHVDRDDVDDALGHPGELAQQARARRTR